ncbi:hypothetical protein C366_04738 [Cryptococcus neoformans Tu401-1]|nr:hypothetical protein C365_04451 [Cryptococcus neoformans var. grubii Bt85]OXG14695.1 hypothetical protein C366_04738 [Cryptococcus neoformans var. grubii Tu401-1]OXM77784.1 hypothetical protein C364_04724 [Cryptococcus neoformans var. grubii Bt63]
MSRPNTYRRPSGLSIRPPSPPLRQASQSITTPTYPSQSQYNLYSPRRNPLPPSPTVSNVSYTSSSKGSSGVGIDMPPPLPVKSDKRLPVPPQPGGSVLGSPYRGGKATRAVGAGAYDNKLVSSTLSRLPPLPPLPSPGHSSSHTHSLHPPSHSSTNLVVFPDGTPLTDHAQSHGITGHEPLMGRVAENMTMAHTSPSSPWSLLTVHVLPLFAGSALKTPLEDLNQLCHSHIVTTSQRSPPARIVALLSSDLREFIASGMLTLKAKFDTLEESKVVSRAAEVWSFFWTQVLPYVEGVFLPFTQLRDVPTNASSSSTTANSTTLALSPIPVRHLLLSGFLLHILLPLLPRLMPLIMPQPSSPFPTPLNPPSPQDLSRILQMSLVLSTQAKYSSFFPPSSSSVSVDRDEEVRNNVESLGQAVRYRNQQNEMEQAAAMEGSAAGSPAGTPGSGRHGQWTPSPRSSLGLQQRPSIGPAGRYRRRGWRASSYMGQLALGPNDGSGPVSRQNSTFADGQQDHWWGRPMDEDDEDDDMEETTPNSNLAPPGAGAGSGPGGRRMRGETTDSYDSGSLHITGSMMSGQTASSTTTGSSTLTAGSTATVGGPMVRGESLASYGETPTPSANVLNGTARGGGEMMYGRYGRS